ncbi:hypothetical protein AKJ16_DCAP11320 [Drosera capensis]
MFSTLYGLIEPCLRVRIEWEEGDLGMETCKEVEEYRKRLDKSLLGEKLVNAESVRSMVDYLVHKRTAEVSDVLDMLRSGAENYAPLPHKPFPKWKVKQDDEKFWAMYRAGPEGTAIHTITVDGYVDAPLDACLYMSFETSLYPIGIEDIPKPGNALRFDFVGGVAFQKISENRSFLSWLFLSIFGCRYNFDNVTRLILDVDIKISYVPKTVVNFVTGKLAATAFRLYDKWVASISEGKGNQRWEVENPICQRIRDAVYLNRDPDRIIETIMKPKDVHMGKQGRVAQYRERLDKTLSSHKLSDEETLSAFVKDQTLCSQENNEKQGIALFSDRVSEFTNVIDMLRSASDNYVVPPNKTAHPSWKVKTDNKDLRVMYREGPLGSPIHTLLAEGYIDAPTDICLCVAWEATLYRTWFPELRIPTFKIIIAKCLQTVRVGEQVSLIRVKVPWPLTAREVILRYSLFEYFEDDLIIGVLNSVPDAKTISLMDDEAIGAGQAVRMGFVGGFALQKVTEDRSYFRTMANLDMKLDLVPPWLINFISRQVIGGAFKLYKKSVASVSVDNMNFGKILNDPMYRRIQEGIYLRDRAYSDLENVHGEGDAHNERDDCNQIKEDNFRDESKLRGTKGIHPSSSKHTPGDKSSTWTGEEIYLAENSAEDSKSTDELHNIETVNVSGFKEKILGWDRQFFEEAAVGI